MEAKYLDTALYLMLSAQIQFLASINKACLSLSHKPNQATDILSEGKDFFVQMHFNWLLLHGPAI